MLALKVPKEIHKEVQQELMRLGYKWNDDSTRIIDIFSEYPESTFVYICSVLNNEDKLRLTYLVEQSVTEEKPLFYFYRGIELPEIFEIKKVENLELALVFYTYELVYGAYRK